MVDSIINISRWNQLFFGIITLFAHEEFIKWFLVCIWGIHCIFTRTREWLLREAKRIKKTTMGIRIWMVQLGEYWATYCNHNSPLFLSEKQKSSLKKHWQRGALCLAKCVFCTHRTYVCWSNASLNSMAFLNWLLRPFAFIKVIVTNYWDNG